MIRLAMQLGFVVLFFGTLVQLTGRDSGPIVSQAVENPSSTQEVSIAPTALEEKDMDYMTIEVGGETFSATLADNEATRAFADYLPMTVQMGDLNGREKFYDLPDSLPVDTAESPATIHSGDIFCWSGNTLVLFYGTFSNSYGGYVRLGTVDDAAGLAAALGSGNVEVTWSLEK